MRNYLKDLAIHTGSDYKRMISLLNQRVSVPYYSCHTPFITYGEEDYPECFYDCQYPPLVLFYYGNLKLLNNRTLAVVGSRDCSNYAYHMTQSIISKLSKEYVIVSGLAKGIDAQAHRVSLDGLGTVGFLGCGINRIYPYENEKLIEVMKSSQLVMSEYYGKMHPKKHYFPWRNRLIVAAGSKLLVMSCRLKSGTMRSVNEAVLLDRDIYALPFPLDDSCGEGCLQIVNEGATLLTKSIIESLLDRR